MDKCYYLESIALNSSKRLVNDIVSKPSQGLLSIIENISNSSKTKLEKQHSFQAMLVKYRIDFQRY